MNPADIGALVAAGDPRVSPDGSTVAFTVTSVDLDANEYRSRVWTVPADGTSRPRPLTAGEHRDGQPRWSPDGSTIAFVSARGEDGGRLLVLPVDRGGEAVVLASSPEAITGVEWSPDGAWLAYATLVRDGDQYASEKEKDQPPRRITRLFSRLDNVGWTLDRPNHVFVVPADASAVSAAVTAGDRGTGAFCWSPDSKRIAFTSSRHDDWDLDLAVDLFVVDVQDTGSALHAPPPERLTATGPAYGRPAWSPDGTCIAVTLEPDPQVAPSHHQIALVDAAGGDPVVLTRSLDRNCSPFGALGRLVWDDDAVLFSLEDAGAVHVYRVATRGGPTSPELVLGGRRTITAFDQQAGTLAFTAHEPVRPAEVFVAEGPAGGRRVTSLGERFVTRVRPVAPERFSAVSRDGTEVEAWVMPPSDPEPGVRYPTLLNIHGGPFTQYGWSFFDEFQMEAAAGYAVVFANPRGSSGYSEAWGRAIRGPVAVESPGSGWGGVDYEDLMAVVDAAVERFAFVDGDRIGVLGGSYGGYMTSWIVGHTDRFRAAVSERGVNNLLSLETSSDIASIFRTELGASHLDAPDEYARQSPITYVRDITTPLLIVHSENDLRCPIEQAEQLFVALRLLGREVEFVRFPGEGHELSRSGAPRHRVQRMEIILEWFDRHLKK